jgi:hypothetical protein
VNAACAYCRATPCQCFVRAVQLDEAAIAIEARDEDGNLTDRRVFSTDEEGRLAEGDPPA